jgi:hypothetical protein
MTTNKALIVRQNANIYIPPLLHKCTDVTGLHAACDLRHEANKSISHSVNVISSSCGVTSATSALAFSLVKASQHVH